MDWATLEGAELICGVVQKHFNKQNKLAWGTLVERMCAQCPGQNPGFLTPALFSVFMNI